MPTSRMESLKGSAIEAVCEDLHTRLDAMLNRLHDMNLMSERILYNLMGKTSGEGETSPEPIDQSSIGYKADKVVDLIDSLEENLSIIDKRLGESHSLQKSSTPPPMQSGKRSRL